MKLEIKNKNTGEILVTGEGENENLAFLDAVKNSFSEETQSANLESANLENANLVHVDSRNLQLDEDKEILFRMDCCVWPITIWHNKVHIGCKEFEFSEILEMTEEKAESINDGAGKRWKRFGNTLKTAILDIQSSGI